MTLYAKWSAKTYVVRLNSTEGELRGNGTITAEYNTTLSGSLEKPENPGHSFVGWYIGSLNGEEFVLNSTRITSNMTLYAKWESIPTVIVSYDSQGGSNVTSDTVEYNKTISEPNNPNLGNATSATFVGWYKDKDLTDEFNFGTKVTENMTLYAKWSVDSGDSADDNVTYGTIYYGGRVWLDRNLGATRLASNVDETGSDVCGNYYQWGRGNDGHEIYNSTTSPTQIAWDTSGNDKFIKVSSLPYTWMEGGNPENKTYNTMNNPCPTGFRVPTKAEFESLQTFIGASGDYHKAYLNELKMVRCGYRDFRRNDIGDYQSDYQNLGIQGQYWSENFGTYKFLFTSEKRELSKTANAFGFSVRCIKK